MTGQDMSASGLPAGRDGVPTPRDEGDVRSGRSPRAATRQLGALTGLRFFAAFHVLLFHYGRPAIEGWPSWANNFIAQGPTSVTLFFVLSGFILSYNYLDARDERTLDRKPFWSARFARVYPVYALGLLISLPVFVWTTLRDHPRTTETAAEAVGVGALAITLLQAWIPQAACRWNCPGWSLSVEALFYALFPFVAILLARRSARTLMWSAVAVWCTQAVLMGVWLLWVMHIARRSDPAIGPWLLFGSYFPLLRLPQFIFGMILGKLFLVGPARLSGRAGQRLSYTATVAALIVFCLPWTLPPSAFLDTVLLPIFGAIIIGLAAESGPLATFLSTRTMVLLGGASYSLYLLHAPIHQWMEAISLTLGADVSDTRWFFFLYCGVAIAISVVVFTRFEEPARSWLKRRL